jgi:hypothetical protein
MFPQKPFAVRRVSSRRDVKIQEITIMHRKLLMSVAALALAVSPLTIGVEALAQSDTGTAASGGAAGGDGPSATGIAASGGVAGGNPPGAAGGASGNGGEVSENLGRIAGLPEVDRQAALDALSDADRAALKEECEAVTVNVAGYPEEIAGVCVAADEE